MRLLAPLFILSLLALPLRAEELPRVLSLNLCADAYLMGFAEKNQIAALTHLSRNAAFSPHAEAARAYPVSDGQIEAIIDLQPEIIIVSSWSDPMRNRLIERLGFSLLVLDAAQDYDSARAEIITLGKAIGREAAARAYLAKLDAEMATAQPIAQTPPRILPAQRRNLTVGRGHILDDIITRAGAVNLGRSDDGTTMHRVSLESALAANADFILLNETAAQPDSRGMEFITHPAMAAAYPPPRRLFIDNNLLVCAGASTPRAVAALLAQLSSN